MKIVANLSFFPGFAIDYFLPQERRRSSGKGELHELNLRPVI
jgi:hypothetical protein